MFDAVLSCNCCLIVIGAFMQTPDFKHYQIKTVAEIVVRNAWTEQLTRAFAELTTHQIQVRQNRFARLCLAPLTEIG